MRLAKYLAHAGVASRRAAETLIAEGRVSVGEEVVTDPARDVGPDSRVALDGRPLAGPQARAVYAVNKPVGVVSTARDTHGRPTVIELVARERARLYPVGRLDADSSGLILLTNDGELANRLTHPRFEIAKTYRARLAGPPISDAALRRLSAGVALEDGPTAPARVRRVGRTRTGTLPPGGPSLREGRQAGRSANEIELTLHEGRNRQVRRMCQAVGHPVLELVRTRFGPLRLGDLAPGEHRRLTDAEIGRLRAL